jgi:hypothetical protein
MVVLYLAYMDDGLVANPTDDLRVLADEQAVPGDVLEKVALSVEAPPGRTALAVRASCLARIHPGLLISIFSSRTIMSNQINDVIASFG